MNLLRAAEEERKAKAEVTNDPQLPFNGCGFLIGACHDAGHDAPLSDPPLLSGQAAEVLRTEEAEKTRRAEAHLRAAEEERQAEAEVTQDPQLPLGSCMQTSMLTPVCWSGAPQPQGGGAEGC